MQRILMVLTVAIVMAAMLAVMAAPAFAQGRGNPELNAGGNCPQGQDLSTGGEKKCPAGRSG